MIRDLIVRIGLKHTVLGRPIQRVVDSVSGEADRDNARPHVPRTEAMAGLQGPFEPACFLDAQRCNKTCT